MLKKCLFCKKEFNFKRSVYKYCSRKCADNAKKTGKLLTCKICDKKFWVNKFRLDNENPQYCSVKCGCKIAKQKGENIECIVCGKKTYTRTRDLSNKKFCSNKCRHKYTRGSKHHNWINGKSINKNGYIIIQSPDHPKNNNGYVLEHRLVMEKHLGRYLKNKEVVHHINGIRNDNRLENLMLFPNNTAHIHFHKLLRNL